MVVLNGLLCISSLLKCVVVLFLVSFIFIFALTSFLFRWLGQVLPVSFSGEKEGACLYFIRKL